jgi:L-serine deaminase
VELGLAQRYFEHMPTCGFVGSSTGVNSFVGNFINFSVPKRATPTFTTGATVENVNLNNTYLSAANTNGFRYYGETTAAGAAYITRPVSASSEL